MSRKSDLPQPSVARVVTYNRWLGIEKIVCHVIVQSDHHVTFPMTSISTLEQVRIRAERAFKYKIVQVCKFTPETLKQQIYWYL